MYFIKFTSFSRDMQFLMEWCWRWMICLYTVNFFFFLFYWLNFFLNKILLIKGSLFAMSYLWLWYYLQWRSSDWLRGAGLIHLHFIKNLDKEVQTSERLTLECNRSWIQSSASMNFLSLLDLKINVLQTSFVSHIT